MVSVDQEARVFVETLSQRENGSLTIQPCSSREKESIFEIASICKQESNERYPVAVNQKRQSVDLTVSDGAQQEKNTGTSSKPQLRNNRRRRRVEHDGRQTARIEICIHLLA